MLPMNSGGARLCRALILFECQSKSGLHGVSPHQDWNGSWSRFAFILSRFLRPRFRTWFSLIPQLACVALIFFAGCGTSTDTGTADRLAKGFESADSQLTETVGIAEKALRAQKYETAIRALNRVAARPGMSAEQREAVLDSYHHVLKTVDQNPTLDTPSLYRSMAELNYRLHGEN